MQRGHKQNKVENEKQNEGGKKMACRASAAEFMLQMFLLKIMCRSNSFIN